MRNVVVGVDFTSASDAALSQAMALAGQHAARLTIVHGSGVSDAGMAAHDVGIRAHAGWTAYVSERLQHAEDKLADYAGRCRAQNIDVATKLSNGFADASIVSTAHQLDAELVVVGTHGRTGSERWLHGSVAERVCRLSERNVLVARPASPARGQLQNILVATDFSATADEGLSTAIALASPGASLTLLHCWDPGPPFGLPPPADMRERARDRAQEKGNQYLAQRGGPPSSTRGGCHVRFMLKDADPVSGLLEQLSVGEYDILVIGSHGRRGVRRLILGSVAEHVIRHATHSVLVVHGTAE